MAAPESAPRAGRTLDSVALQRLVTRLHRQPQAPWLHTEVARRMAQRLPVIKLQPATVLDWSSFLGGSQALLSQAYPAAQLWQLRHPMAATSTATATETATAPAVSQRPWWSPQRWATRSSTILSSAMRSSAALSSTTKAVVLADLPPRSVQLVWANMALHHELDIGATLRTWQTALAVDGFLMFSTLGPGSLTTLRRLYADADGSPAFAPFVDMHDLGDMLVHAGFADPVMDQEPLTLTWPNASALLGELRLWGANLHPQRRAGLCTPRWKRQLEAALTGLAAADGRIALDFELVFGHAFKAMPRPRVSAETSVAVEDLRAMARARRA